MNSSPSPPPPSEIDRLQRELAEKTALVQSIRKELILSQITVLELQDTVLQKETDKADAIAILGQAELVLEGKINYIFELDRVLNLRLSELQAELASSRTTHESIAADLVQKLDQANRALGDAHSLAAKFAREAAETRDDLARELSTTQQLRSEQSEADATLSSLRASLESLRNRLDSTVAEKVALAQDVARIRQSFAWKITAPLRALTGRKS